MRTTVDIPAGAHARARRLAAETGRSLSKTLADLVAAGLEHSGSAAVAGSVDPATGLLTLDLGASFTDEDVARLTDEES
ncbi:MAG: hypothetical protein LBS56_01770 [Propionibacteriaceae bacterium]|jgi:hypothetical protein|nr:hypothetical protein [Propionibacteriaceae bacterium]